MPICMQLKKMTPTANTLATGHKMPYSACTLLLPVLATGLSTSTYNLLMGQLITEMKQQLLPLMYFVCYYFESFTTVHY